MNKTLDYNTDAIKSFLSKYRMAKTTISDKVFGQPGNKTMNRWLEGKDIYFTKLLMFCNELEFDLLSFIAVDGKVLRSTLKDILALEEQGKSVRELMKANNLKVPEDRTYRTLSPDFVQYDIPQGVINVNSLNLPAEIIEKIHSMLVNEQERAKEELNRQEQHMRQTIDLLQTRIDELEKDNKKLRAELERKSRRN